MSQKIILILFTVMMNACISPAYPDGKQFTFDNKEMESKLIYSCEDNPNLEAVGIRAKKANDYFVKEDNAMIEKLMVDIKNKVDRDVAMSKLNQGVNSLASTLKEKFSCVLIETIDY